eukprot:scaffold5047_cov127-Skeletonema_menzelii.AAC.8
MSVRACTLESRLRLRDDGLCFIKFFGPTIEIHNTRDSSMKPKSCNASSSCGALAPSFSRRSHENLIWIYYRLVAEIQVKMCGPSPYPHPSLCRVEPGGFSSLPGAYHHHHDILLLHLDIIYSPQYQ